MHKLQLAAFLTLLIACNQKSLAPKESHTANSDSNAVVEKTAPAYSFYGSWVQCVTSPLNNAGDNSVLSIKQVDTFKEDGTDVREETYFKDTECKVPFTTADSGKTFKPRDRGVTGAAQGPNYAKCGQPIDYSLPGSLSVPEHWCIDKLMAVKTTQYYFEVTKLEGGQGCILSGPSNHTQINPFAFEIRGDKLKIERGAGYYINKGSKAPEDIKLRESALKDCEEMLAGEGFALPYYTRVVP